MDALRAAADAFGLDIFDGEDKLLLYCLADLVFGRRQVGRPSGSKHWSLGKLIKLGKAAEKYRSDKKSNTQVARMIVDKSKEFRSSSVETIRRRLPDAFEAIKLVPAVIAIGLPAVPAPPRTALGGPTPSRTARPARSRATEVAQVLDFIKFSLERVAPAARKRNNRSTP